MIVYKVVGVVGKKYKSVAVHQNMKDWMVWYKIGKQTKPKQKGTYLYAFTSERLAKKWMRSQLFEARKEGKRVPNWKVLKSEAETVKDKPMMATTNYLAVLFIGGNELLSSFWKDGKFFSGAPEGTIWCKWIKPLEVIE